jgi:hypothetical protein
VQCHQVFRPEGIVSQSIGRPYVERMEQLLAQGWPLSTVLFRVMGISVADPD